MPRVVDTVEIPKKAAPSLEVTHRKMESRLTHLPEALEAWAAGKGYVLTLIHADPRNLAQESTYGRVPLYVEDLPDEVVKACRARFEPAEKHGGHLHVGDCLVACQSLEEQSAWREHAKDENERYDRYYEETEMQRLDSAVHQMNAEAKRRGGGALAEIHPKKVGRVSDHVFGGKEAADL